MLAALYARLREKEGHLIRLQTCLTELNHLKDDFMSNQKVISEPDLTSTTWSGTLAEKFTNLRENEMVRKYNVLENHQLENVIFSVETKILEVKNEIESIKMQIAAFKEQEKLNASKGK